MTWSWWTPLGGRTTAVNADRRDAVRLAARLDPARAGHRAAPAVHRPAELPDRREPDVEQRDAAARDGVRPGDAARSAGRPRSPCCARSGLAGSAASAYALPARAAPAGPAALPVLPAALGGALFGFSPAMTAQSLGHPNLVFNPLLPVLVLLSLRLMLAEHPARRDRGAARRDRRAAGADRRGGAVPHRRGGRAAAGRAGAGPPGRECPPARAGSPPRRRSRSARSLLVAGFPLGYQLLGPLPQHGSPFDTAYYSVDLANYVLPNQLQALGAAGRRGRSRAGSRSTPPTWAGRCCCSRWPGWCWPGGGLDPGAAAGRAGSPRCSRWARS